jgi:phage shock protein PspC (stress-responsive transcriptional regulator)
MKRLYRNKSDVMIAGVCSGLGQYLDVDPTAIRLAFVLLLFVGLGGLWIYLVLWIIMPLSEEQGDDVIEAVTEKKTPAPKKVTAPKQSTAKKPTAKKAPAKKPAAKQPAVKTTPKKKPADQTSPEEEKKE